MSTDQDNAQWDDLDVEEALAVVRQALTGGCDRDRLAELAGVAADIAQGDWDGGLLGVRLEAVSLLVALAERDLDRPATDRLDGPSACGVLFEFAEDGDVGPAAQELAAVLLRAAEAEAMAFSVEDLIDMLCFMTPQPALADEAAAMADRIGMLSAEIPLRAFASCGSPRHAGAFLAALRTHADDIYWPDLFLLSAVVALGERAGSVLPILAERLVVEGEHVQPHLQMLGARLLPHLEGITTPWVAALAARIRQPSADPEAWLLGIAMVCASAPVVWPGVVAFAEAHPALLRPSQDTTAALLNAVAYSGCAPGALMPALVEAAAQQERWLTLLAVGDPAVPAIRARLADADGEVASWLEQVLALLGG